MSAVPGEAAVVKSLHELVHQMDSFALHPPGSDVHMRVQNPVETVLYVHTLDYLMRRYSKVRDALPDATTKGFPAPDQLRERLQIRVNALPVADRRRLPLYFYDARAADVLLRKQPGSGGLAEHITQESPQEQHLRTQVWGQLNSNTPDAWQLWNQESKFEPGKSWDENNTPVEFQLSRIKPPHIEDGLGFVSSMDDSSVPETDTFYRAQALWKIIKHYHRVKPRGTRWTIPDQLEEGKSITQNQLTAEITELLGVAGDTLPIDDLKQYFIPKGRQLMRKHGSKILNTTQSRYQVLRDQYVRNEDPYAEMTPVGLLARYVLGIRPTDKLTTELRQLGIDPRSTDDNIQKVIRERLENKELWSGSDDQIPADSVRAYVWKRYNEILGRHPLDSRDRDGKYVRWELLSKFNPSDNGPPGSSTASSSAPSSTQPSTAGDERLLAQPAGSDPLVSPFSPILSPTGHDINMDLQAEQQERHVTPVSPNPPAGVTPPAHIAPPMDPAMNIDDSPTRPAARPPAPRRGASLVGTDVSVLSQTSSYNQQQGISPEGVSHPTVRAPASQTHSDAMDADVQAVFFGNQTPLTPESVDVIPGIPIPTPEYLPPDVQDIFINTPESPDVVDVRDLPPPVAQNRRSIDAVDPEISETLPPVVVPRAPKAKKQKKKPTEPTPIKPRETSEELAQRAALAETARNAIARYEELDALRTLNPAQANRPIREIEEDYTDQPPEKRPPKRRAGRPKLTPQERTRRYLQAIADREQAKELLQKQRAEKAQKQADEANAEAEELEQWRPEETPTSEREKSHEWELPTPGWDDTPSPGSQPRAAPHTFEAPATGDPLQALPASGSPVYQFNAPTPQIGPSRAPVRVPGFTLDTDPNTPPHTIFNRPDLKKPLQVFKHPDVHLRAESESPSPVHGSPAPAADPVVRSPSLQPVSPEPVLLSPIPPDVTMMSPVGPQSVTPTPKSPESTPTPKSPEPIDLPDYEVQMTPPASPKPAAPTPKPRATSAELMPPPKSLPPKEKTNEKPNTDKTNEKLETENLTEELVQKTFDYFTNYGQYEQVFEFYVQDRFQRAPTTRERAHHWNQILVTQWGYKPEQVPMYGGPALSNSILASDYKLPTPPLPEISTAPTVDVATSSNQGDTHMQPAPPFLRGATSNTPTGNLQTPEYRPVPQQPGGDVVMKTPGTPTPTRMRQHPVDFNNVPQPMNIDQRYNPANYVPGQNWDMMARDALFGNDNPNPTPDLPRDRVFIERLLAEEPAQPHLNRGIINPGHARLVNVGQNLLRAMDAAGTRRPAAGFRQPQKR